MLDTTVHGKSSSNNKLPLRILNAQNIQQINGTVLQNFCTFSAVFQRHIARNRRGLQEGFSGSRIKNASVLVQEDLLFATT